MKFIMVFLCLVSGGLYDAAPGPMDNILDYDAVLRAWRVYLQADQQSFYKPKRSSHGLDPLQKYLDISKLDKDSLMYMLYKYSL